VTLKLLPASNDVLMLPEKEGNGINYLNHHEIFTSTAMLDIDKSLSRFIAD